MLKKKGFTLTELIAVIAILALLVGIATVTIINVRNNALQSSYDNVVSLLETEAARYAEDTGVMTITVEELITEGYVEPDDETDIYNPINNESLNCHLISSVFEDGEYISTFGEDIGGSNGTCNEYDKELDLIICEYNSDFSECNEIGNEWLNRNVTLGIKYRNSEAYEIINSPDNTYAWQSSDGGYSSDYYITTTTNIIYQGNYSVRVTFSNNEISEANKEIKIDLQAPTIVSAIMDESSSASGWAKEKYATITASDFSGSGVYGIFAGEANECSNDLSYQPVDSNNQVEILLAEDENLICVMDNAGNVSDSNYVIDNDRVDGSGVEEGDISLTASTTDYAQSLNLIGTAIDHKSGLVAYQFTTTNNYYESNWIDISLTNEEIRYTYDNVTSNGTYYFWVKDAVGNVSSSSYAVTNIDRSVDSVTARNNTSGYETSVSLTGTATDNLSGIVRYQWTTSPSEPTRGWTTVSARSSVTANYTANSNGTYYFWVEDAVGNTKYANISVNNVVRRYQITVPLYSEADDLISYSYRIDGIRELESVTVDNGYVSSSSVSGNYVYFTVRNGYTYQGSEPSTCTTSPSTYRADSSRVCSNYYCPSGGRVSGSRCVANRGSTYTLQGNPFTVTCYCSNGKYACYGAGWTECAEGYHREGNYAFGCTYNKDLDGTSCSGSGSVTDTGRCKAYCYWDGDYNASCSGYENEYYCDSGDVLRGTTCYTCNRGSINSSGTTCRYSCTNYYSYWRYTVTITYYAA